MMKLKKGDVVPLQPPNIQNNIFKFREGFKGNRMVPFVKLIQNNVKIIILTLLS